MRQFHNRTKIVATLGPASEKKSVLREMLLAGVNVIRLNFSHGEHEWFQKIIKKIRQLDRELNTFTSILADLQGPKIRIGDVENGCVELVDGSEIVITTKETMGTASRVHINYGDFPKDVSEGEKILIDDGKLVLEVLSTNKKDTVKAKVIHGGSLHSKKGVNLPDTAISTPSLTKKDLADLQFALDNRVHWVALSFVRKAEDIYALREIIRQHKTHSLIVAKIEKPEAIKNLDDIIEATDAVMVARGDLGVEIKLEEVPLLQKQIVLKCQQLAKPVIIATQMMETMIENYSPTRAEVNDVANAIMDGADAVMLSGETSVGKYPVEVINVMSRIIQQTETFRGIYNKKFQPLINTRRFISDNICFAAIDLAEKVAAKGILTMTFSGYTAFKISSFRPKAGVFVFTGNRRLLKTLSLVWGTKTLYYDKFASTDQTIRDIKAILRDKDLLMPGDLVVNIMSMPIKERGQSNSIKLSYI